MTVTARLSGDMPEVEEQVRFRYNSYPGACLYAAYRI
ncbi:MAG: hypothetical protein K0R57_3923 [Paenibacillaceae bacterium]|jgi:hypothetical protein|nr:hypothetical protein [Paenibacillaceae bacterium]